jgi:hypothetical protein
LENGSLFTLTTTPLQPNNRRDNVQRHGVLEKLKTSTILSKDPSDHKIKIISNYVKVEKFPGQLHQYSLNFHRNNNGSPIVLDKRHQIIAAVKAMEEADVLKLKNSEQVWATDYKDLWCTSPLPDHPTTGEPEWPSRQFDLTQPDGKVVHDLIVTVKFQKLHDGRIETNKPVTSKLAENIRALNAQVASRVREHNEARGDIIQIGANKFFLKQGFQEMGRVLKCSSRILYFDSSYCLGHFAERQHRYVRFLDANACF